MKAGFLFVGLNLNTSSQEKMPEKCVFYGCPLTPAPTTAVAGIFLGINRQPL